ncbi:MAG: DNA polymerase I [Bacilli bacterium]|nr:DNA polymerase I [Bacilli bacterium]
MKKVILVDGNNLLFRSFFATSYTGNIMKNSKGFPTNALYGFINMINKIIDEEKPSYILVAFDKGKTFRHEKYDSYKAGRHEMPDELKQQFPKAKELLDAMGIKHYEIDNYEADDIIGTLAKIVDNEDEFIATIISSDKDLLQLISDEVDVKLLKTSGFIRMDKEEFKKTYCGLDPIKMIDIKALMGDSSDNIKGVKGIGEKTALKLLSEYGSLEDLYKNIDSVSGKTKEKLLDGQQDAFTSYEIATIYKDVPLDFELEDLKYEGIKEKNLSTILNELEFHSLIKKYNFKEQNQNTTLKKEQLQIKDISTFNPNEPFSYYIEVRGEGYSKSDILGVSIYDGKNAYYISPQELDKYKEIFTNQTNKYTYDVKKNIVCLNNKNIKIANTIFDTMIACYLLDYTVKDDISFIAKRFGYDIKANDDFFGTLKRPLKYTEEELINLLCEKARFIYETRSKILDELSSNNEMDLFTNLEMPLAQVLSDMEITGIKIDVQYLESLKIELEEKMQVVEKSIYEISGETFNIMSPKQLAQILFVKLAIPYPKRVKDNNYSTSKDILDKLKLYPIVDLVLKYRMLAKLYSNYAVGLKNEVREDGRIHTIFNQTLTRTGRLSSIMPNLQNIPARTEYGRLIRKAFIPDENSLLLSCDYSQVELRVFAHMSGVDHLKDAFLQGKDIHTKTAADIYKVKETDVTKDMRRTAKAVNFGILYGISSFGLSEDLGIDISDAKSFLENYLSTYQGIKDYMETEKQEAYQNGYVKTLMGRRRVIEELQNKNYLIRSQGERMALNTPIQGTAADILKKAMIEIYNEFNKRNLKSKMLIQVHDELIFNVLNEEKEEVLKIVTNIMENTFPLSVPLKVDANFGKDWHDAK